MSVPRNHAFRRCRQRQDLRHRQPHRPRVHPDGHEHDVVEEYDPLSDTWNAQGADADRSKRSVSAPTAAGSTWQGVEITTQELVGAFRAIEAYDPLTNSWSTLPSMPMPRHGAAGTVIGNRLYLVSGMIQSAGALVFLPAARNPHGGARHSGAAVQSDSSALLRRAPRRRLPRQARARPRS
jgi:hypothetical protein